MKQEKIKKNEIYAYVLEGTDAKGQEEALIAKDELDEKGVAKVYSQAKELWEKGFVSKVHIFGIDEKGVFYHGRPDKSNFEDSKIKYAKNLIKGGKELGQSKNKGYVETMINILDQTYGIRLRELYSEKGKETNRPRISKKKKRKEENER